TGAAWCSSVSPNRPCMPMPTRRARSSPLPRPALAPGSRHASLRCARWTRPAPKAGSTSGTSGESKRVKSSNDAGSAARMVDSEAATAGEPTDPASSAGVAATGWAAWLHRPGGPSATGGPIASRLGQVSWAMFECARIPYVLLVTIYLFGPYFTRVVFKDPVQGQIVWSSISSWGAIADNGGRRKPWIFAYTVLMVAAMLAMWVAVPHASTGTLWLIAIAIVVA